MKNTKKVNNTNKEDRLMWSKNFRPQQTKNLVEKKRSLDKKYKKDYRYCY